MTVDIDVKKAERSYLPEDEIRKNIAAYHGPRADAVWAKVEVLLATTIPKSYQEAVRGLTDLRDLATTSGSLGAWQQRIAASGWFGCRCPSSRRPQRTFEAPRPPCAVVRQQS